ncbi:uncharacterized protein LOC131162991 [Malania oleifera]|uniref:uncharacterized protein LOC131162991 n=1 Tax=Malania oleifera TaxID=397392 RepID=UPI0025AECB8E|nr:uncharacterized protein LOC131162991 [Malania oleifera]
MAPKRTKKIFIQAGEPRTAALIRATGRFVHWELILDCSHPMQTSVIFAAKPLSAPICIKSLQNPATFYNPSSSSTPMAAPKWAQKTVSLPPHTRGCHLVTPKILKEIGQDLSGFKCGLAHFFLQHTSASLTINENYDSDVRDDTETFLNRVVPEGRSAPWKHTLEGPDDMPAHIKSSMFGCSLTIPITNGQLNMGTWQGIWLCEHRDSATSRKVVVTINGI